MPKSEIGKRISALNSLTHGLNINGFLPCKQHRCYFVTLCSIAIIHGEDILKEIPYGYPCPLELAKYDSMAHGYAEQAPEGCSVDKLHELIMLNLRYDRQLMLNSLDGDITRAGNQLALSFRYRQPIVSNIYKLTRELFYVGQGP